MAASAFSIEQTRLAEARHLPRTCYDDFLRLTRSLLHGPRFQWLLVDAPHEGLRDQVMAAVDKVLHRAGLRSNLLPLSEKMKDVAMLEQRLVSNASRDDVVHVIGGAGWFDDKRWEAFNIRRERLAASAQARLVFWLDAEAIALASRHAPDHWAWRGGVYPFLPPAAPVSPLAFGDNFSLRSTGTVEDRQDNRWLTERSRRVAEIKAWLENHPDAHDELKIAPFVELGDLLYSLKDFQEAEHHWREVVLPFHRRRGDARAEAIALVKIADILQLRGCLEEALQIYQEEAGPIFEKLGLVRLKAMTVRKIADVYEAREQLEEALRIHQEELLPVYETLGDQHSKAVVLGKIADIMQARGRLVEALLIRQQDQLPIFKSLDDAHSVAVTMGRIADIFQARGQFDEALLIRQKEQLPVYERLGDKHSEAVTMGKIAEILQARGQWYAAREIREKKELPVYQQENDLRAIAMTNIKIIEILLASEEAEEAWQKYQRKASLAFDRLDDEDKLVAYSKVADLFQSYGHPDAALKIRQQEAL